MDRVARRGPLARAPGALTSHNAEKLKGGDPLGFFNIHSVAKHQKNAGGTLWGKIFRKKVSQCRKKIERGDSLVSPGMVCYAEKQVKTILVQFARPNSAIWHHNILQNF